MRSPTTRKGFTLTELIVSVGIFALIISIVIGNFRRGAQSDELRRSAEQLLGNLRLMQTLATTGREPFTGSGVPAGGYGVAINWQNITNVTSYSLFANYVEDPSCQAVTPAMIDLGYDPGCPADLLVEGRTVGLQRNVRISRIRINGTTNVSARTPNPANSGAIFLNVTFQPPKPIPISFNEVGPTVEIELTHRASSQQRTITVIGASGQIQERLGGI